ncbi:FAD-dependent monooxygenase [Streptomyces aureus]|uniref:FAD-dependent monooxygenase n=1 Tax=Streptomyces aureus TaxID=193461 RepID=UPI000D145549|nr:FAD-dependent monooxygenase [Streptomyces aureus]
MTSAAGTTVDVDVLVVGAGPTGLALGVDLARRGVDALVVERGAEPAPGSRGKGIQPRTMEVLDDLGVLDDIRAAGGAYPVGLIWQNGRPAGERPMFDPAEDGEEGSAFTEPWMVPQWRTQEILHARLTALGGRVAFSREVTALDQDEDGVTVRFAPSQGAGTVRFAPGQGAGTVRFAPGQGAGTVRFAPNEGAGTVRARYVVAADGGRSAVRRAVGIGMTGAGADGSGVVDPAPILVADALIDGLDRDHWHLFPPDGDTGGFMAVCPLAGTEYFQIVAGFAEGTTVDVSPDGVRKVFAARSHLTADAVTEVNWVSEFRPRAALADRFRSGRVFLAGDAAHIHSPAGGQGLNTSVQDAYNLGWKLGAVLGGEAPATLLDTYEEERRPVAAGMLGLSTKIHRGEARRGRETRQLGLGYRGSSLAAETRTELTDEALRAGDRAPDTAVDGGRLFDVLRGPHWTLLTAGPSLEGPALPGVRTALTGSDGRYGPGLYLIRPDGYVGWAGTDPRELRAYASRVGLSAG